MKAKVLQFGKAISAALFVLLLSVAGLKNALAQNQVATLQHGDSISVFYGQNAFVEAHTVAADGDIVTLSGGSFTVPSTISKAITLRGAGVVSDSLAGTTPTIFTGLVKISVNNDTIPFQMEGILFTNEMQYGAMYNPKFTRCSFNKIISLNNNTMHNALFVNCIVDYFYFSRAINTTFINSVVWRTYNPSDTHNVLFYNSIFDVGTSSGIAAFNSVVVNRVTNSPSATCTFFNCIGVQISSGTPFGSGYTSNCVSYTSYEDVFESFAGAFSLEEPFILKDEIVTGFLGGDGTQVGIYGGTVPYNPRPGHMVIRHCNVANKSTVDGKLSVEIEVYTEND